jgi:hypothetical protein
MVTWAATSAAEVAEMTSSAAASSSQAGFRKHDGDPARRVVGAQNACI